MTRALGIETGSLREEEDEDRSLINWEPDNDLPSDAKMWSRGACGKWCNGTSPRGHSKDQFCFCAFVRSRIQVFVKVLFMLLCFPVVFLLIATLFIKRSPPPSDGVWTSPR